MPENGHRYDQRRGRVYLGENLDLSRSCSISSTSLLGSDVKIGSESSVVRSTLGTAVTVGSSSRVQGSYVFAEANVADNCVVRDSIIGERVKIGRNSTIEGGCLIAPDTVIGEGSRLVGVKLSTEAPVEGAELTEGPSHRE